MSDVELELIKLKKLRELQKKLVETKKEEEQIAEKGEDPVEFLKAKLTGRGPEILEAALSQYPEETRKIAEYLTKLYKLGQLKEPIDDVSFYNFLRRVGLPIRLETRIFYLDKGEVKPISEKFKAKED